MISYVKGTILFLEENKVVVLTGGWGVDIYVPSGMTTGSLNVGDEVALFTHMHVKEDALTLYGFTTREQLSLFQRLISVSGVGPKGGLSLLSTLGADELVYAIYAQDAKKISTANGIGKKTAERIIIDLRDKIPMPSYESGIDSDDTIEETESGSPKEETIQALMSLGYGRSDAVRAVTRVKVPCDTSEQLLREALKNVF